MKRVSGRFVLLCLGVFFTAIIAVNVLFIVLSVKTFSGEDESQPYLQGVAYNKTLAQRRAQAELGWHANLSAARLKDGAVRVTLSIADAKGIPQGPGAMAGRLRHPADEERDRDLRFRVAGPGLFVADLKGVAAGYWDVVTHSAGSQIPFDAERRVWVP